MKIRDVYGDWRILIAVVLLALGTGNWLVGLNGIEQYSVIIRAAQGGGVTDYRNLDELDPATGSAVLAPLTVEQRKVSFARAHLDFYHAVYVTGRILFGVGLIIFFFAMVAAIRRDSRRMAKRAAALRLIERMGVHVSNPHDG